MILDVFVPGIARPQGSLRATSQHGRVRTFHVNHSDLQAWRGAVTVAAADLWGDTPPLDDAVVLSVDFWLQRPKSAKRRLRPHTLPDLDKLVRAVGDALTGIVFTDDARIVDIHAAKHYADGHTIGARIVCGSALILGSGGQGEPRDVPSCTEGRPAGAVDSSPPSTT